MFLLAPISTFLGIFVFIYQWLGLPLVLIIWLTSGFAEAAIYAFLFICTHFMLGATVSKLFRLGRVKTGFPAIFGFLIWGGAIAFITFIASSGYPFWMKLSYWALALSASTSPVRQILHVFNELGLAYDSRIQLWTAYTSISGAAGMAITWSLLVFLTIVPPWRVFRGGQGFFSNESRLLGFNLDDGSAKMRLRIQKEHENEEALRKLLSVESDRIEYIPADNTVVVREQQRLADEWRGKLYNFRATVADSKERAKVDEFLRLMDELDASFQRQKGLMERLAEKFPTRGRSSAK